MISPQDLEAMWRAYLTGEHPYLRRRRRWLKHIPHDPRCKSCNAPFGGIGRPLMRLLGRSQSIKSPNFCDLCETFARMYGGGAEVELTMLFADVRGSTGMAERMAPAEFSRLMNRFYAVANKVLIDSDALIDKLVGDEVIGFFLPYLGPSHPRLGVEAALDLLRVTGHGDPGGPWLPVGAGVHTGTAYVGAVGSGETVTDFTALGDAVNVTARLASAAGVGEVLISEAAYGAAGLDLGPLEHRELDLRGRAAPIGVRVLRVAAKASASA